VTEPQNAELENHKILKFANFIIPNHFSTSVRFVPSNYSSDLHTNRCSAGSQTPVNTWNIVIKIHWRDNVKYADSQIQVLIHLQCHTKHRYRFSYTYNDTWNTDTDSQMQVLIHLQWHMKHWHRFTDTGSHTPAMSHETLTQIHRYRFSYTCNVTRNTDTDSPKKLSDVFRSNRINKYLTRWHGIHKQQCKNIIIIISLLIHKLQ